MRIACSVVLVGSTRIAAVVVGIVGWIVAAIVVQNTCLAVAVDSIVESGPRAVGQRGIGRANAYTGAVTITCGHENGRGAVDSDITKAISSYTLSLLGIASRCVAVIAATVIIVTDCTRLHALSGVLVAIQGICIAIDALFASRLIIPRTNKRSKTMVVLEAVTNLSTTCLLTRLLRVASSIPLALVVATTRVRLCQRVARMHLGEARLVGVIPVASTRTYAG